MKREIDIGGNQGRGNPEIRPAPRCCESNRLEADTLILDPDGDWQDSAQAIVHETAAPRVPRERSPTSLGSLLLAVVIVCLCAATVLVACDAGAGEIDCTRRVCT